MCYAKPGPRCSNYALKMLRNALEAWVDAHTDAERSIAMENLKKAEKQYDTTPIGQRDLKSKICKYGDPDGLLSARLEVGIAKREQMLESIGKKDIGDIDDIASPVISPNGDKAWYLNDKLHRGDDKPAFEYASGSKAWYLDGKLHRDGDKPAYEGANGTKEWWVNGKLHREGDKPAVEYTNGTKSWYFNGKRHREDGKPAIEYADGSKAWYINGKWHRKGDKPAVVVEYANVSKEWWVNGGRLR